MVREVNVPTSINLEFEDFCEKCPYIELSDLGRRALYSDNALYLDDMYNIKCEHADACRRIHDLMKGEKE